MNRLNRLIRSIVLPVCVLLGAAGTVSAQYAPDGNAHPDTQLVTELAGDTVNPFGAPVRTEMSVADKEAFAARLDLSPLYDLAVFHNGRVKILQTLAEESVERMTGRHNHFDLDRSGEKVRKVSFDPVFTLFDIMIDPAHYVDRPTIGIGYLPLRQQILQRAVEDPAQREAWLRTGMVSPRMVDQHLTAVMDAHAGEEQYRRAAGQVDRGFMVFVDSWANLNLIAPEASDRPWIHLGQLPETAPARVAATRLAQAWRNADADGVNSAARELAEILPTINAAVYPTGKRSLESLYNRSNAFEWGYWIYLVSLVSLVLAFGTGRKWLVAVGIGTLIAAMALHALGFGLRWAIAERFPIQNQFESMTGLSLFAAIVGFVAMIWKRQWLFGAAAAATGFMVLITATETGIPGVHIEREAAILNTSVLLKYHVTTVLTSYGLIALGFIISLFYLGTHYAAKFAGRTEMQLVAAGALGAGPVGDEPAPATETEAQMRTRRTLRDLDTAHMTVLQLAFWTLGVGILLGAWWADHSWGRWWAFDPKETWALVTWIVYLIVIHVRMTGLKDRGLTTAWLSVAGFIIMLWTYFGVNLLLPGLHAYA
ncbi:cytochrome c biogenesis protein CcsA [Nodularia spumigena]|uniref:cytochrome c biogenesis protein CcsA n=1 Tax=Nodularia spumigena TaxID=70799 RepID=UPI002B1F85DA|nr:cytochrome c biogenesis protein CcsA [Nodularia spumigena]MEA5614510.1 cytochrome c biogenesis protein CcsA [Nodularia spumigena UHCC 0040]